MITKQAVIEELKARLSTMTADEVSTLLKMLPTDQLLALAADRPQPRAAAEITMRDAITRVLQTAERPLTSLEIVERVTALRKGSHEPSIRSELSAMHRQNLCRLLGDHARGGVYAATGTARSGSYRKTG